MDWGWGRGRGVCHPPQAALGLASAWGACYAVVGVVGEICSPLAQSRLANQTRCRVGCSQWCTRSLRAMASAVGFLFLHQSFRERPGRLHTSPPPPPPPGPDKRDMRATLNSVQCCGRMCMFALVAHCGACGALGSRWSQIGCCLVWSCGFAPVSNHIGRWVGCCAHLATPSSSSREDGLGGYCWHMSWGCGPGSDVDACPSGPTSCRPAAPAGCGLWGRSHSRCAHMCFGVMPLGGRGSVPLVPTASPPGVGGGGPLTKGRHPVLSSAPLSVWRRVVLVVWSIPRGCRGVHDRWRDALAMHVPLSFLFHHSTPPPPPPPLALPSPPTGTPHCCRSTPRS